MCLFPLPHSLPRRSGKRLRVAWRTLPWQARWVPGAIRLSCQCRKQGGEGLSLTIRKDLWGHIDQIGLSSSWVIPGTDWALISSKHLSTDAFPFLLLLCTILSDLSDFPSFLSKISHNSNAFYPIMHRYLFPYRLQRLVVNLCATASASLTAHCCPASWVDSEFLVTPVWQGQSGRTRSMGPSSTHLALGSKELHQSPWSEEDRSPGGRGLAMSSGPYLLHGTAFLTSLIIMLLGHGMGDAPGSLGSALPPIPGLPCFWYSTICHLPCSCVTTE
jgi:hypothetical protein